MKGHRFCNLFFIGSEDNNKVCICTYVHAYVHVYKEREIKTGMIKCSLLENLCKGDMGNLRVIIAAFL